MFARAAVLSPLKYIAVTRNREWIHLDTLEIALETLYPLLPREKSRVQCDALISGKPTTGDLRPKAKQLQAAGGVGKIPSSIPKRPRHPRIQTEAPFCEMRVAYAAKL